MIPAAGANPSRPCRMERDVPYGLIDLASWAPPERRCRSRRYSWRSSAHHGPSALPARPSVSQGVRQEPGQAPSRRPGPALGGRACRGELLAGGEAASDRQGIGLATAARAAAHLARIEPGRPDPRRPSARRLELLGGGGPLAALQLTSPIKGAGLLLEEALSGRRVPGQAGRGQRTGELRPSKSCGRRRTDGCRRGRAQPPPAPASVRTFNVSRTNFSASSRSSGVSAAMIAWPVRWREEEVGATVSPGVILKAASTTAGWARTSGRPSVEMTLPGSEMTKWLAA